MGSYYRNRVIAPGVEREVARLRRQRDACMHPSGTSRRTAPDTNIMECDCCRITIAVHRWKGPARGWVEDYYYLEESADVR